MAASPHDTIAAVSSPPGRSLHGLVRLSGPLAMAILQKLTGDTPLAPRLLTHRFLFIPPQQPAVATIDSRRAQGLLRVPASVLTFLPPASYTGQEMVEIQCHGHPSLLARVLDHVLTHGARMAEPGEFTFRAYLSGRLDLTQAEGVAATIAAQSDAQLHAATLLRQGKLGQLAHELVDTLAESLAAVEAGIDFTDQEDVVPIAGDALLVQLGVLLQRIERTLTASRSWGRLDALPSVVMVGQPSVGKSTLFNALLGKRRSVISPQPGTTRDILIEPLSLSYDGRATQVLLTDVAGLDEPLTAMDHQVQQAARHAIAQADVILSIGDHLLAPPPLPADTRAAVLHVRTKADLPPVRLVREDELPVIAQAAALSTAAASSSFSTTPATTTTTAAASHAATPLPVSDGLDSLRQAIAQATRHAGRCYEGELLALEPRHQRAMEAAASFLQAAMDELSRQVDLSHIMRPELVAGALRHALDELASLGGQMTPDDVIGRVFARFCVGK